MLGKTEFKGKAWHWITTTSENITHFKDWFSLHILFCICLHKMFSNHWKTNTMEIKKIKLCWAFTLGGLWIWDHGVHITKPGFGVFFSRQFIYPQNKLGNQQIRFYLYIGSFVQKSQLQEHTFTEYLLPAYVNPLYWLNDACMVHKLL